MTFIFLYCILSILCIVYKLYWCAAVIWQVVKGFGHYFIWIIKVI